MELVCLVEPFLGGIHLEIEGTGGVRLLPRGWFQIRKRYKGNTLQLQETMYQLVEWVRIASWAHSKEKQPGAECIYPNDSLYKIMEKRTNLIMCLNRL